MIKRILRMIGRKKRPNAGDQASRMKTMMYIVKKEEEGKDNKKGKDVAYVPLKKNAKGNMHGR